MGRNRIITLPTLADTIAFGRSFAKDIRPNDIIALRGNLGAGKTTFVKGLSMGLGFDGIVQSPTFTLLHQYEGILPIFHFDLYRMKTADDFFSLGFEEYFEKNGVCVIEWPEVILPMLPKNARHLELQHKVHSKRVLLLI